LQLKDSSEIIMINV